MSYSESTFSVEAQPKSYSHPYSRTWQKKNAKKKNENKRVRYPCGGRTLSKPAESDFPGRIWREPAFAPGGYFGAKLTHYLRVPSGALCGRRHQSGNGTAASSIGVITGRHHRASSPGVITRRHHQASSPGVITGRHRQTSSPGVITRRHHQTS